MISVAKKKRKYLIISPRIRKCEKTNALKKQNSQDNQTRPALPMRMLGL